MIETRVDHILKLVRDGSILSKTAFASADLSAASAFVKWIVTDITTLTNCTLGGEYFQSTLISG